MRVESIQQISCPFVVGKLYELHGTMALTLYSTIEESLSNHNRMRLIPPKQIDLRWLDPKPMFVMPGTRFLVTDIVTTKVKRTKEPTMYGASRNRTCVHMVGMQVGWFPATSFSNLLGDGTVICVEISE